MAESKKKIRYRDLQAQLQAELTWFEGAELDIDEALERYAKAGQLIKKMQKYLVEAGSTIEKK